MAALLRPDDGASSTLLLYIKLSGALFSICLSTTVIWFFRQPKSPNQFRTTMLPDSVYRLCHEDQTVTSELLRDPSQSPPKVFHHLYNDHKSKNHSDSKESLTGRDELQKAAECGNWGNSQPSKLFLQVSQLDKLLDGGG